MDMESRFGAGEGGPGRAPSDARNGNPSVEVAASAHGVPSDTLGGRWGDHLEGGAGMAEGKCRGACSAGACGSIWAIGWLFTIGYLQLTFWRGVLAIVIWPYYLGVAFGPK
jgi:hypothetical protein